MDYFTPRTNEIERDLDLQPVLEVDAVFECDPALQLTPVSDLELEPSARSLISSGSNISPCSELNLTTRSCDASCESAIATSRYIKSATLYPCVSSPELNCLENIADDASFSGTASETRSDIVPPLDLQSEDNYAPALNCTYSYRKHCHIDKLDMKSDVAYQTWLSAKKKVLSDKAERRRQQEQAKRDQEEERKRISQEHVKVWLEKKEQQKRQQQMFTKAVVAPAKPFQTGEYRRKVHLDEWERTKQMQLERRRAAQRQKEEKERELKELRRQAAADSWANWAAKADKKPKPVPLNRGIFSLRGTISDIFVNPNEWQSILPGDIVDANE